jgi:hypothetical protein
MTSEVENPRSFRCKVLTWVRQSLSDQTEERRMSTVDGQSRAAGGSWSSEPADLKREVVVSYKSLAMFDPDGNRWLCQEVTDRLPGRLNPTVIAYDSAGDVAEALRRAASADGEQEKRIGPDDLDGPDGYAEYMARAQSGQEVPT